MSTTDTTLMQRAQNGDHGAFGELARRHRGLIERTVRPIVPRAIEDVAQQTFLSAWLSRARYDAGRGTVTTWLCGIARNRAIDALRADRRHTVLRPLYDGVEDIACATDGPADIAGRRADAEHVLHAVTKLGDDQRTAITLAYFAGLSQSEIATRTGAPIGTVKGRVRLGLTALRADLIAS